MKNVTKLSARQKNYLKTKSMVDMILGSVGMVVLSPVFLAIAVAIKLEDGLRAPVFFSQKRVGINKKKFQKKKKKTVFVPAGRWYLP